MTNIFEKGDKCFLRGTNIMSESGFRRFLDNPKTKKPEKSSQQIQNAKSNTRRRSYFNEFRKKESARKCGDKHGDVVESCAVAKKFSAT
ncbi:MAG: hypothetical protein A3H42_06110 [Deltaproteobacteria bacterium RIFCSPLOWO2_02_FULL_46_8]|nr:MAG: hypothetical protein A3H42_06110 [Deltaproteobacteria bacterium RIFCSPLOWO2_02_FULL_46_8]